MWIGDLAVALVFAVSARTDVLVQSLGVGHAIVKAARETIESDAF